MHMYKLIDVSIHHVSTHIESTMLMVTLHSRASGNGPIDQTNESIIRIMINQIVTIY